FTAEFNLEKVNYENIDELVFYREGKEVGRAKSGSKVFIEKNLQSNTEYVYEVKSLNSGGFSLESTVITVKTQIPAPPIVVTPPAPDQNNEEQVPDEGTEEGNTNSVFKDIDKNFAKNEIEYLASTGVIKGVSPEIFAPDRSISRVEFAALIVRALEASPN
ncbi:S-layer homology domain-containing protein, partial [Mycobacterium tuberculosis]|uniref:S-layer homology domain-containing protein n=1 Tax=Mycobacterium tuberculosis TaxID=1773 RepID=UPI0015876B43